MTVRAATLPKDTIAIRIRLRGHVQGIGMRPAIARLAAELHLAGTVANDGDGVVIHAEGSQPSIEQFRDHVLDALPPAARVESMLPEQAAVEHLTRFVIRRAESIDEMSTRVPPDIAVCAACLSEVANPNDHRAGYAFTSCTDCGPRYSILRSMPYERCDTSMEPFVFCDRCAREYQSASDRRFHAQTNACPECGPSLWASDRNGQPIAKADAAIQIAAEALLRGDIVAIKGIGGYQLLCDATNDSAVGELRKRKHRKTKPLPIMVLDAQWRKLPACQAQSMASWKLTPLSALEPSNPIVIVADSGFDSLSPSIHPGLNNTGMMLPTTPLHWLLVQSAQRPLVVTSGNCDGDPLAYQQETAQETLSSVADLFLHHDRAIVRPIDDSVVRLIADRPVTIRAARGIAPLPLNLDCDQQILAVGGQQKVAIALSNGRQSVLGPHVGDLSTVAARERFIQHVAELCQLYRCQPNIIAHDLHPDYFTTRWATEQNVPKVAVQHHHAHVVAGMIEHDWLDRTVLGIACDGTGLGTDGTIWGGEFLIASAKEFDRVACLRPFLLPGGEAAIREPWRVACSLLSAAIGSDAAVAYAQVNTLNDIVPLLSSSDANDYEHESLKNAAGPITSSLGRLFDGVAAIVLGVTEATYEGEPAAMLEAACNTEALGHYTMSLSENGDQLTHIDWRPLIRRGRP